VQFTFDVRCPIFVARQWMRHRTGKFNEISGRYSELPEEFYIPEVSQITTQSASNKQMRTDTEHPGAAEIQDAISFACAEAFKVYHQLLKVGCPRELARGVLPLNTYTHFFFTMDLHNLAHFLRLRLHEHSQYEIRVYAQAMLALIEPIVPVAVAALKKHGSLV
jgi:thymidylate synthase (FAD)